MPAKKSSKPGPGRPKLPTGERSTSVNTSVGPAVREYLTRIGDGSPSRGLRLLAIYASATGICLTKPRILQGF